jgi:hypothetical protein
MKILRDILLSSLLLSSAMPGLCASHWTAGMKEGKPAFASMGPLSFGPDGILFAADTKGAVIYAIATGDTTPGHDGGALKVDGINQKIAALLGTAADQILIEDMAVNPISRNVYLAVSRGRGTDSVPVLVRVKGDGELEVVSLDRVKFSKTEFQDAPADKPSGQGNRQSNPRRESITDVAFLENRLIVAGLSNEEFASTLRSIPFPFGAVEKGTSVEMYHGSHGKFETRSPIRTFVPMNVGNTPTLLAAYTCTPLVELPLSDLKPGAKVKGKTVAELGNRNRPIDMIVYQKGGKDYLLLANNSRGVMKISTDQIEKTQGITKPVADKEGLPYETISKWTGVDQLDRLDAQNAVVLRHAEGGTVNLESLPLP